MSAITPTAHALANPVARGPLHKAVTPPLQIAKMVSKGFQEADWAGLLDTAGYPPAR